MDTFQGIVNGYLQFVQAKPSSGTYQQLYQQYFVSWTAHPTFLQLEEWHAMRRATPHQANKALAFLRTAYTRAIVRGHYGGINPALGIKQHGTKPRKRVMDSLEVAVVLHALDLMPLKLRALLPVLLTTGCRLSEALRTQRTHINLVTGQWVQYDTKNGEDHHTYLPTQARAALALCPQGSPYVFEGVDGQPYSVAGAEKAWNKVRVTLGLADVRLHDFRRTWSTHAYRATKDLPLVKRCINHHDPSVTMIYVKFMFDEVQATLQAQADRFYALTTAQKPVLLFTRRASDRETVAEGLTQ